LSYIPKSDLGGADEVSPAARTITPIFAVRNGFGDGDSSAADKPEIVEDRISIAAAARADESRCRHVGTGAVAGLTTGTGAEYLEPR
jgi:hypothetical protein